jgi:hypothetical protein
MDIIVDRPQLVRVVKLYLTKSFGNLTTKTTLRSLKSVFYVSSDNKIIMEHDKQNKEIWFDYDNIWSKLESFFYLNHDDILLIMEDWLEEHYNLKKVTLRVAITLGNI